MISKVNQFLLLLKSIHDARTGLLLLVENRRTSKFKINISLLSEIRFRVMKALPSIAFNELKGSLSSFYVFTIKDTNSFLETVKFGTEREVLFLFLFKYYLFFTFSR